MFILDFRPIKFKELVNKPKPSENPPPLKKHKSYLKKQEPHSFAYLTFTNIYSNKAVCDVCINKNHNNG